MNDCFFKVRYCAHHVLNELLPLRSDSQHNLTKRCHNLTLTQKKGHLLAKNFIIRLLYKDTYTDFHPGFLVTWLFLFFLFLFLHYYSVAFCQLCFYNKDWLIDYLILCLMWILTQLVKNPFHPLIFHGNIVPTPVCWVAPNLVHSVEIIAIYTGWLLTLWSYWLRTWPWFLCTLCCLPCLVTIHTCGSLNVKILI